MKLTFGIIVLNGGFFLRQVLESIYPFAHKICIAEGPVKWFVDQGVLQSTDDTLDIIKNFPDTENKIVLTSGTYIEKDDQCRAWFAHVPSDTDYVVCNDADEVHTPENLEKLIQFLEKEKPTSVGFKSDSFYGGFQHIIGGFERDHSFKRVLQYIPMCYYRTHRQPTLISNGKDIEGKDISGNQLCEATGITMPHFSYTSPLAVKRKIEYYEKGGVISAGNCIPNYFIDVFMKWVLFPDQRQTIEDTWLGVQEFLPIARGYQHTRTEPYYGILPDVIIRDMPELQARFHKELQECINAIKL